MIQVNAQALGVDISTSSVKVARIAKSRKGLTLSAYAEEKIPVSALVAGVIRQPSNVQKALTACLANIKYKHGEKGYAVCTIPDDKVYTQETTFPELPIDKLKEAIEFKIQSFIPLPIQQVYWDFQVIAHNTDKTVSVIIAAASKETVDSYYAVVKAAGLTPLAFESSSTTAMRATRQDASVILIDVGKTQTTISLAERGAIKLSSTTHIGLNQLIKEYDDFFKTDDDKSLQILHENGIAIENKELIEKLKALLGPLLQELQQTITFASEALAPKIIMYGEGSDIKGLTELLKEASGIDVVKLVPTIKLPASVVSEKIIPVLGAAMRHTYRKKSQINFLPPIAAKELYRSIILTYTFTITRIISYNLIGYIVVAFMLIAFFTINQKYLSEKLTSLQSNSLPSEYASVSKTIGTDNAALTKIKSAEGASTDWIPFLSEVPQLVPSGVQLTAYAIAPAESTWDLNISGVATSRSSLLQYLNNLEYQSKFLTNVSLPIPAIQSSSNLHFTITATLLSVTAHD